MRIEQTILKNLIKNEQFTRKALPFLKEEYFTGSEDRLLFKEIVSFINKYNTQPTTDALLIEVDNIRGTTDEIVASITETVNQFQNDNDETNIDWLIDSTEKFCQERAIYNAITSSLEIMNGKGNLEKGAIPSLLSDALAISFDPSVGHDYLEQADERFDYYHKTEERIPFDLDFFNKITKGGVPGKTLNIILGGPHSGKSLLMCHLTASYLNIGKNVLYISMEMAEKEIAKRIDTNLLNVSFDDLQVLPKDMYNAKISKLRKKTNGKLVIKEYAATSASVIHFKSLLNELKLKKNFTPDVVMIDYLNICASARLKVTGASETYTYIKSVSEEIRGFAQQSNLPVWTGCQLNRSGSLNTDPDMSDVADSFGISATADMMFVLINNDQMKQLNQIMVKQLKNRYHDMEINKRFVVGIDKSKMRMYDVEQSAQDIVDSGQDVQQLPKLTPKPDSSKDKFKQIKVY